MSNANSNISDTTSINQYVILEDPEKLDNPIQVEYLTDKVKILDLGSALCWIGITTTFNNLNGIFKWINQYTAVEQRKIYVITGNIMNEHFDANYSDDLNIVALDLQDMCSPAAIILPRFEIDGHWLDDVIYNVMHQS